GVLAADTGHISTHEAGAIEYGGHKVLTLPHTLGKITAQQVRNSCRDYRNDVNHEHMVMPGMVYISQPTEYGTLYSLSELQAIHAVCRDFGIPLYADGARLAYALSCGENDVSLPDLARLCDAFYIGGTKCGALFGEALVIPNPNLLDHFFTVMKQHGALLAKGRLLGIQFDTLFTDGLYMEIGKPAIHAAEELRSAFARKGYRTAFQTPTNQIFIILENEQMQPLAEYVDFSFWEKQDETHSVVRFATSWATEMDEVRRLETFL
ncbi:MAG: low specificity L-threonine aldolase, partial [Oscillibacter sp.]|nr:low specificity L-threonine aldolase [Oscillibacter sp.]